MIASLLIGIAVWCAAGAIAVATPDSAASRLAVLAPWWWFFLGAGVAAAIKPLRMKPLAALPALLTILPWLPLPMPVVALIWTGSLAWLPIAVSVALAVGLHPLRWLAKRLNLFDADDATVAAFVLAAVIGGLSAWSADPRTPSGDEPHYLMITQSLLKDGDIDIQNNHDRRDWQSFFGGDLRPDLRVRGIHGEAYSIHAPGVSALVAPVFQFFGYKGARFLLVLLVSIGAMLTWRLCWRVTDSAEAAWFGWAAVALTPTFALQSFMVFPDAPGFLITAAALLQLVRFHRGDLPSTVPVFFTGVALAALPWLHTRFAVLAAGFGAAIALRLLVPSPAPPRSQGPFANEVNPAPQITLEDRVIRLIALLIVPVISAGLWFWFFKAHYGTFDPRAPYGPEEQSLAWIVPAILALFFDGEYGIAAYAPAVALAFAGWWRTTNTFTRRLGLELALITFVYLAAVSTVRMWWAGNPATPARFLMSVLPLLAVPAAVAWTRFSAAARAMAAGLVAIGAVATAVVIGIDHAALAWNYRCDNAAWLQWLGPVVNLPRVWPGFFWNEPFFPWHVVLFVLTAAAAWLVVSRAVRAPRVAAALWVLLTPMTIAALAWLLPGAMRLNAAPAQLEVVRGEGQGARVFAIGTGRLSRVRTLKNTLTLAALAPGSSDECPAPAPLAFNDVPGARYTVKVASRATAPVPLTVKAGRGDSAWREFTVPGPGTFTFPVLLPTAVSRVVVDTNDAAQRDLIRVTLGVDDAMPARDAQPARSAAHFGNADTQFFDDQVFVEKDGFWVRGGQATRFLLSSSAGPVSPLTMKVLVRNGGTNNQVSVESGGFQKLLLLKPFEEVELDIPLTPLGTASVRVASSEGFVPAKLTPGNTDQRNLGVWIEPR